MNELSTWTSHTLSLVVDGLSIVEALIGCKPCGCSIQTRRKISGLPLQLVRYVLSRLDLQVDELGNHSDMRAVTHDKLHLSDPENVCGTEEHTRRLRSLFSLEPVGWYTFYPVSRQNFGACTDKLYARMTCRLSTCRGVRKSCCTVFLICSISIGISG